MHLIILFEISHWGMSNCDQLTHGHHGRRLMGGGDHVMGGGDHVHGDSGPFRGSFQTMLYDKPWYRPGYYIGVLLACMCTNGSDLCCNV